MKKEIQKKITIKVLNYILPVMAVSGTMVLAGNLTEDPLNWKRIILSCSNLIVIFISYILNRKKKAEIAASLFIFTNLIILFVAMFANGGIHAPAFFGLSFVLIGSTLFFNMRVTIALYLLSLFYSGLLIFLDAQGILIMTDSSGDLNFWISVMIVLGVLIIMIRASLQQLEENIKKREEQAKALEEEELLTQIVFDSVSDALIIINPNGCIIRMNHSAETAFLSNKKKLNKHFSEAFILSDESGSPFILSGDLHFPIPKSSLMLQRNDTKIPVILSGEPLQKKYGPYMGIIITIRDVSREKEIQIQLLQNQKMEVIGQMASGIAHDFNNMLSAIIGSTELLEEKIPAHEIRKLDIIKKAVERASQLTRQLLDFSHKGNVLSSRSDIHEVINDTMQMLRQIINRNITVESDLKAEMSIVSGDDNQIMNSLINMAINSSHAMPDGGHLRFSTTNVNLDQEYCTETRLNLDPGNYIRIDIIDTGTGIDPKKISHIFDPFYTTKKQGEGTGLGLTAVKDMVESQNGIITVYSELGEGTSFHIYLPVETIYRRMETETPDLSRGHKEHILIIDDEEILRITTKTMLENLNYKVTTVSNGEDAIKHLEKNIPDLIILDMIMPGMNGKKVFSLIRELQPDLPVLLCSGFSKDTDVQEMLAKNLNGFIRKPYTKNEIAAELKRILLARKKKNE